MQEARDLLHGRASGGTNCALELRRDDAALLALLLLKGISMNPYGPMHDRLPGLMLLLFWVVLVVGIVLLVVR